MLRIDTRLTWVPRSCSRLEQERTWWCRQVANSRQEQPWWSCSKREPQLLRSKREQNSTCEIIKMITFDYSFLLRDQSKLCFLRESKDYNLLGSFGRIVTWCGVRGSRVVSRGLSGVVAWCRIVRSGGCVVNRCFSCVIRWSWIVPATHINKKMIKPNTRIKKC
jgi:hypothetical protein